MHIYTHTYKCICTSKYMYIYVRMYTYTHMHSYIYINMCVYTYILCHQFLKGHWQTVFGGSRMMRRGKNWKNVESFHVGNVLQKYAPPKIFEVQMANELIRTITLPSCNRTISIPIFISICIFIYICIHIYTYVHKATTCNTFIWGLRLVGSFKL